MEFKAVRDLGHLDEKALRRMRNDGVNAKDIKGQRLEGHHHKQLDHRHPDGFIVEIPADRHNYRNKIQHPKPVGEGLSPEARRDWNNFRKGFNKARAEAELIRRGIHD